jgi:hypothetical protein
MNVWSGRTFAVPGRCWKAGVLPNPAVHAISRSRADHAGHRPERLWPRKPLIVHIMTNALSGPGRKLRRPDALQRFDDLSSIPCLDPLP